MPRACLFSQEVKAVIIAYHTKGEIIARISRVTRRHARSEDFCSFQTSQKSTCPKSEVEGQRGFHIGQAALKTKKSAAEVKSYLNLL